MRGIRLFWYLAFTQCLTLLGAGGYGSQGDKRGRANAALETIWFSPHCIKPDRFHQLQLLEGA